MAASSKILPIFLTFLLSLLLLPSIQSKPVKNPFGFIQNFQGYHKGQTVKGLQDVKLYLSKYGYLNLDQVKVDEFDDALESAIRTYHRRHSLKVTGGLDAETVNQMMKPRCGVPDIVNNTKIHNHHDHSKSIHTVARYRFFPGNPRWPDSQTELRYRFLTDIQVPGTQNLRSSVARAFQKWAQVSQFTFEEVDEDEDSEIVIGFHGMQGRSSDDPGFDGPQGTLAHAFAPTRGIFHLDADEDWSGDNSPGPSEIDLESVAVHEIGHLLGLGHSQVPEAIMFPTFEAGTTKRNLDSDDIEGIRNLYGLQ
ncbi:Peptidase M10, metallopeptidase [Corchorus capsularis]|uniref:Peptidase M10, metallopeptidase n=1 Tax=Corchorus capsularis TaxID=210143 RepID=A0A1R3GXM9_COCAP|nr:Peptidase M10, metallopeptidase [Corchorus capsularis]